MADWFTVDQLDPRTFAISGWGQSEEVHSYLLIGNRRALLVDTGTGIDNIKKVVDEITVLPIHVLTTHAHWDHTGGHGLFDRIAVHPQDAEWLEHGLPIAPAEIRQSLMREPFRRASPPSFDLQTWTPFRGAPTDLLVDGETIDLGDRKLTVLHTPGHSPGHVCFFEASTGYLVTGDLLYSGELHAYYPSTDPITFAHSVARIAKLEASRLLPGHHSLGLRVGLVRDVSEAFESLREADKLRHGTGLHTFAGFSIRL